MIYPDILDGNPGVTSHYSLAHDHIQYIQSNLQVLMIFHPINLSSLLIISNLTYSHTSVQALIISGLVFYKSLLLN